MSLTKYLHKTKQFIVIISARLPFLLRNIMISMISPLASSPNTSRYLATPSWISGKYILKFMRRTKMVLVGDGEFAFSKKNFFYLDRNTNSYHVVPNVKIDSPFYNEYKHYSFFSAFRTGKYLYINNGVSDEWELVYNGKRGIYNSMCFIERDSCIYLLFIEYTPGEIREQHRVLEFSFDTKNIREVKRFYTYEDYLNDNTLDYCRHIHVIQRDPFTNDIYVGTGDSDSESKIYISKDQGISFQEYYSNGQETRTLSFLFTEKSIFWTTDTHQFQFIIKKGRTDSYAKKIPLVNGALWHTIPVSFNGTVLNLISSNSEGHHFDNYNRLYGVIICDDTPVVYELFKCRSYCQYSQFFLLSVCDNYVYMYDIDSHQYCRAKICMQ